VDSEELAGRLAAAGWRLVTEPAEAEVAVINTCGFVEQAKSDSINTVFEAVTTRDDPSTATRAVVAVGCLAERYGRELAASLPEADAVLGFDSYRELSAHLDAVLRGERPESHVPRDRRLLLPLAPGARSGAGLPGHGQAPGPVGAGASGPVGAGVGGSGPDLSAVPTPPSGPPIVRRRLAGGPWAPLKIASGCDRRCAFCAIPRFRGSFVSRPPEEVLAEARWLAGQGVRELFLVSENSTSYGKDLGDVRMLEGLLPRLAAVDGVDRVRVSYLQPAEMRPGLVETIASTPGVAPYFDLSFQHASPTLLRRMRRFGGTEDFLALIRDIRERCPGAGIRSNVIVGFPGETERDIVELERFLQAAGLDHVGVFGYSDEDHTEAETLPGTVDPEEVAVRRERITSLVEELMAQRAEDRIGETVRVLVEEVDAEEGVLVGRADHQGPEVDGETRLGLGHGAERYPVGSFVEAVVVGAAGADLVAEPARARSGHGSLGVRA